MKEILLSQGQVRGSRHKISCLPERVKELASLGLSKKEIARKLGMSERTFRDNLANSIQVNTNWREGAMTAGTYEEKQNPKTLWADDEGVVQLQPGDEEIVLKALKTKKLRGAQYPARKRIRHLREITGWSTDALITSIERLIIHLRVAKHESLVFTEYEAFGGPK